MAHSTAFSRFWLERFPPDSAPDGRWLVGVRENLTHAIQTILTLDGRRLVAATPAFAARAGLVDGARLDDDALVEAVARAGARLNGPDHLFGFDDDHLPRLMGEDDAASIRRLGPADADRFARLTDACSPSEVDEAYVEVDHWAAFGLFDGDEIVSAASAYPWRDSVVADIGILTRPDHRGRGHARAVVRAISRHIVDEGYQPLYRCQVNNLASAATARRSAMTRFALWDVIADDA